MDTRSFPEWLEQRLDALAAEALDKPAAEACRPWRQSLADKPTPFGGVREFTLFGQAWNLAGDKVPPAPLPYVSPIVRSLDAVKPILEMRRATIELVASHVQRHGWHGNREVRLAALHLQSGRWPDYWRTLATRIRDRVAPDSGSKGLAHACRAVAWFYRNAGLPDLNRRLCEIASIPVDPFPPAADAVAGPCPALGSQGVTLEGIHFRWLRLGVESTSEQPGPPMFTGDARDPSLPLVFEARGDSGLHEHLAFIAGPLGRWIICGDARWPQTRTGTLWEKPVARRLAAMLDRHPHDPVLRAAVPRNYRVYERSSLQIKQALQPDTIGRYVPYMERGDEASAFFEAWNHASEWKSL